MKLFIRNLLTFFSFFGVGYIQKVKKVDKNITKPILLELVNLGQKYFPKYARGHWNTLDELLADFRSDYPFSITIGKLPAGLIGVFIPKEKGNKKGTIILNEQNSNGMHLSTVAHENGHLLNYLRRLNNGDMSLCDERPIYARANELEHCLHDSEELLADYVGCLGAYPLESFKQSFCDSSGKLLNHNSVILFFKAGVYLFKHYPELLKNFIFTENKLFHLCLTLHFIRLRVFIYENYEI